MTAYIDPRFDLLRSGKACIANRKTDTDIIQWAKEHGLFQYIGRKNSYYKEEESIWHNPFRGRDAIQQFEQYIHNKPELLSRIHELEGKLLVCWCYPNHCHGDILSRLVNG